MKKKTDKMEEIAQLDVDCVMLTGKDLKHTTKADLIAVCNKHRKINQHAAENAIKSLEELTELKKDLKTLRNNQRRPGFTEVPTEEFNDVIDDVKAVSEMLRKIVLDRVDGYDKKELLMDCFQAVERVHSFCIGRANASENTVKEY